MLYHSWHSSTYVRPELHSRIHRPLSRAKNDPRWAGNIWVPVPRKLGDYISDTHTKQKNGILRTFARKPSTTATYLPSTFMVGLYRYRLYQDPCLPQLSPNRNLTRNPTLSLSSPPYRDVALPYICGQRY